ncbi:MAG TPA: ABC transporter permease [Stellaceae bacterium]|nr:ABC transporter permease [Stellaceae bacterium]
MMRQNSRTRAAWHRFCCNRAALASCALLLVLAGLSILEPALARLMGQDPTLVQLHQRLVGPSFAHPLGTDELGRDLLLRLLEGGRVSLSVGIFGAIAASVVGSAIGLAAGYRGGALDSFLMRMTDGVIALPLLPLLIVLAAIDLQKLGVPAELARSETASLYRIVVLVALVGWTTVARLVRGATLSLKARDFVRAAVALGASPLRVMIVHILPNLASVIIVSTALSVGGVILLESVLSYLGLGIAPPLASWGEMLSGAQETITIAPALAIYPGVLIFLVVVACNLGADGLQEALDPRGRTV